MSSYKSPFHPPTHRKSHFQPQHLHSSPTLYIYSCEMWIPPFPSVNSQFSLCCLYRVLLFDEKCVRNALSLSLIPFGRAASAISAPGSSYIRSESGFGLSALLTPRRTASTCNCFLCSSGGGRLGAPSPVGVVQSNIKSRSGSLPARHMLCNLNWTQSARIYTHSA